MNYTIITLSDYTESQLQSIVDEESVIANIKTNTNEDPSIEAGKDYTVWRKSLDGTLALVKWEGTVPTLLKDLNSYNNSQILTILNGSDWTKAEGE